jgi:hypothetical protein
LIELAAVLTGAERNSHGAVTVVCVSVVRFETADSPTETAIGEGLTRLVRAAGRLRVDTSVGKYAVAHGDGCAVCDAPLAAGDSFYLDSDAGEILCATHGRERREAD